MRGRRSTVPLRGSPVVEFRSRAPEPGAPAPAPIQPNAGRRAPYKLDHFPKFFRGQRVWSKWFKSGGVVEVIMPGPYEWEYRVWLDNRQFVGTDEPDLTPEGETNG